MPPRPRRLIHAFPGLLLLLGFVTVACHSAKAPRDQLIIVSPHWEGVQYEFGRAFQDYYRMQTNREVDVRWRDLGGTSQIEKAIDATYNATPDTCGIDIFFGGGIDPYISQKAKGHLEPYKLPAPILTQIPSQLGGFPLIDPDYTFYGAALSSFGILENKRAVELAGLPPVDTWESLCQPQLYGWVSSADPRKSGSVHMIYEIILQAYGWNKGWAVINQMSGNVKSFLQSSSQPTKEVGAGEVAYAVSIDINGMIQQADLGKDNVTFTIPSGVSVINPDGIAILKGAPNLEVARHFLDFVMSRPGQELWMTPEGAPGGAVKFGITRMGILPALYQGDMKDLLVPLNPFAIKTPFRYDSKLGSSRWGVVNDLIGQSVIDVHPHLRAAWKALNDLPDSDPRKKSLLAEFSAPPVGETDALTYAAFWRKDPVQARKLANQWMTESTAKYNRLAAEARKD